MTRSLFEFPLGAVAFLKRRNAAGDILLPSYACFVASLVLSNNYNLAPKIFMLMVVPAAFFLNVMVRVKPSWPFANLSVAFETRLTFSWILFAAFIYVLVLTIATWRQPDFDRRMVDQMWAHAGEIVLFMTITAYAVARIDRFLVRLIVILVPIIAISAAINVWWFFPLISTVPSITSARLVNWLGMPGYTNATNISLTYSIFCVAALAAIVGKDVNRWQKTLLASSATVLFIATLLTQSRSAYIGMAIGAGLTLMILKDRIFWKRHGLKLAAAALLCGVAMVSVSPIRDVVSNRGSSLRPEIWAIYATKATAKPLLGYGGLSDIGVKLKDGTPIDQPHNMILSAQVRGGILCMVAMVTMLIASAWSAFRFNIDSRCAIPLAIIATIIPTGMFDYNLLVTAATWPWLTFWLPFAICAGAEIALRDSHRKPFDSKRPLEIAPSSGMDFVTDSLERDR